MKKLITPILLCAIATACNGEVPIPPTELGPLDDGTAVHVGPGDIERLRPREEVPGEVDEANAIVRGSSHAIVNAPDFITPHPGTIALWSFNLEHGEWRQTCTAVLLTNRIALTAAHCLEADFNPEGELVTHSAVGSPSMRIASSWSGSSWRGAWVQGAVVHPDDDYDIGLVALSTVLPVKTPSGLNTSTFVRNLAVPDFNNANFTLSYGGQVSGQADSAACNAGKSGCIADPRHLQYFYSTSVPQFDDFFVLQNSNSRFIGDGDSGAGVFTFRGSYGALSSGYLTGIVFQGGGFNGPLLPNGIAFGGRAVSIAAVWADWLLPILLAL